VGGVTPFESAQLILKIYELRREPVLREARAWFLRDFNPTTEEEFLSIAGGDRNAWFRMVLGYWDMAASLVTHGAIDAAMFRAANTEVLATFAKVEPFLARLREVSASRSSCSISRASCARHRGRRSAWPSFESSLARA
jgi:hypothetical protein